MALALLLLWQFGCAPAPAQASTVATSSPGEPREPAQSTFSWCEALSAHVRPGSWWKYRTPKGGGFDLEVLSRSADTQRVRLWRTPRGGGEREEATIVCQPGPKSRSGLRGGSKPPPFSFVAATHAKTPGTGWEKESGYAGRPQAYTATQRCAAAPRELTLGSRWTCRVGKKLTDIGRFVGALTPPSPVTRNYEVVAGGPFLTQWDRGESVLLNEYEGGKLQRKTRFLPGVGVVQTGKLKLVAYHL